MPMNVFAKPLTQRLEFARGKRLFERTNRVLRSFKELRGVHVAESVSGKISDETFGPVNVLEAAGRVRIRRDPEVVLVSLGPSAGKIRGLEVAIEKGALELESDQNVKVVGDFVRFDANQSGRNVID